MRRAWLALALLSCGGREAVRPQAPPVPQEEVKRGKELFKEGKFREAAEAFKAVTLRSPVNPYTPEAEYYLGLCYLKLGEFDKAEGAFNAVITLFPQSPFAPKAYLGLAEAYLKQAPPVQRDQEKTEEAIKTLQEFKRRFPDSELVPEADSLLREARERLAEKMLIAIRVYENLEKWDAELHYIKLFYEEHPESRFRWRVKLHEARALLGKGEKEKALEILDELLKGEGIPADVKRDARHLKLSL